MGKDLELVSMRMESKMNHKGTVRSSNSLHAKTPAIGCTLQRKCACGLHTASGGKCSECKNKKSLKLPLQAKLHIGDSNDRYEQEANNVAEQVMRMPEPNYNDVNGLLQVKPLIQRRVFDTQNAATEVPSAVHDVLSTAGQPLDQTTRAFMETRFNLDFGNVRIHNNNQAEESAKSVNAKAYTVGNSIVFGAGQYSPESYNGRHLIAHELTHVNQQSLFFTSPSVLRRSPSVGSRVTHPRGSRSLYSSINAEFDGRSFAVKSGGATLMNVSATSGKPVTVRSRDVSRCRGSSSDSYLNNPRYVGISDYGPIPEGEYRFRVNQMSTFDQTERLEILAGGTFIDPFGKSFHGGDWGAGRVSLSRRRIMPALHCGNPRARSGFYLHGGILRGSSGCIDIGNSGYERLVRLLIGFRRSISIRVKYRFGAPRVGGIDRALGRFTYPETEGEPTILDRISSFFDF